MYKAIDSCIQTARESDRISMAIIGSTANQNNPPFVIGPVKASERFVGSMFITRDPQSIRELCRYADGKVDYILVDVEAKTSFPEDMLAEVKSCIQESQILTYKGNDITAMACDLLISEHVRDLRGKKISIIGAGNIGCKTALKLVERGADVYLTRRDKRGVQLAEALNIMKTRYALGMVYSEERAEASAKDADVLIGFTQGIPAINREMITSLGQDALVIDGGVGTITEEAIGMAKRKGLSLFRLDIRLAFPFIIDSILSTEHFLKYIAGSRSKDGVTYVAGGVIGGKGDIVVDCITDPQIVIGVADGKGGILRSGDHSVTEDLNKRQ